MLSLIDYIKYTNNDNIFICDLKEHILLELSNISKYNSRYDYVNKPNNDILFEEETILNESSGMYNGQDELISLIFKIFVKKLKEVNGMLFDFELTSDELINKYKLHNIFFDKLIIEYKKSPKMLSCFFDNKAIFNTETNMFDKVIIRLNKADIGTKQAFYSTLSHELLHAFELFKHNVNNKSSNDVVKSLISQNEKSYQKAISTFDEPDVLSQLCANIYHDLQKFEINAYIAELKSFLNSINYNITKKTLKDNNNDYNIIINLLRKQDAYNRYIILYEYIIDKVLKSERNKTKFYNIYYNIIKDDKSYERYKNNEDKLINYILKQLSNVINKINKKIPKILADYIYSNENKQNVIIESIISKHNNSLFELVYIN